MPWHKVVILHNDQARWSAAALMRPFIMGYHAHGSTPPENAVVYHGVNDAGDHVYQNMAEDHTCKGVGECHPYREFEGMQPSR